MPTRKIKPSDRRRCTRACVNCKRRKERCDGRQPCQRCTERGFGGDCRLNKTPQVASTLQSPEPELPDPAGQDACKQRHHDCDSLLSFSHLSRMIKDDRGTLMFIGDSSHICFLQNIRRIVVKSFGHCSLVDDPLRHCMVEAHPKSSNGLAHEANRLPPPKVTLEEMGYFLVWFQRSTNCIVHLFDIDYLRKDFTQWLQDPHEYSDAKVAMLHLIIAIGAQAGPEDHDDLAEHHFNFGRYLTLITLMDDPSISAIQCHVLIATYLITGSRRNAAFVYLGVAIRGAYALGLHRRDVSALYESPDYTARERLWRVIRIMDLFMSSSQGRPPATTETRDTTADEDYSASNDLCWIFENILTGIYAKRVITTENLERISELHRSWSSRFNNGLQTDGIFPNDHFYEGSNRIPNIGLVHLKEAYYWTIILLTRPFLVQYVSSILEQRNSNSPHPNSSPTMSSQFILVQACIDSALRTADLLHPIVSTTLVPKRLPFVVNSAFVATLVLGLTLFADLEDTGLVSRKFQECRSVLQKFSKHDAVTRRYLVLTDHLQEVCDAAVQVRQKEKLESKNRSIRGLFGSIHNNETTQHCSSDTSETGENTAHQQGPSPQSQTTPTANTQSTDMDRVYGTSTTEFDVGMPTHSTTGLISPFASTGSVHNSSSQGTNLLTPGSLFIGALDESMLFPTVSSNMMDFGVPGDWERGFRA